MQAKPSERNHPLRDLTGCGIPLYTPHFNEDSTCSQTSLMPLPQQLPLQQALGQIWKFASPPRPGQARENKECWSLPACAWFQLMAQGWQTLHHWHIPWGTELVTRVSKLLQLDEDTFSPPAGIDSFSCAEWILLTAYERFHIKQQKIKKIVLAQTLSSLRGALWPQIPSALTKGRRWDFSHLCSGRQNLL